jgi:hypothetical protein
MALVQICEHIFLFPNFKANFQILAQFDAKRLRYLDTVVFFWSVAPIYASADKNIFLDICFSINGFEFFNSIPCPFVVYCWCSRRHQVDTIYRWVEFLFLILITLYSLCLQGKTKLNVCLQKKISIKIQSRLWKSMDLFWLASKLVLLCCIWFLVLFLFFIDIEI